MTAFLVVRAAAQTALMDAVLGALSANVEPAGQRASDIRRLWLTAGAVLTGLGGLAAAVGWSAAAPLFLAACIGQWTWLLIVAPRFVDPSDAPDPAGRRATRNAALGHTALTIAVLAAWGQLVGWPALALPMQAAAGAGGAALIAFALQMLRQGSLGRRGAPPPPDED
ncbi:hypothetical protein [Phenylobacterium kunshanense]|uniref:Uncharacterized protein n=1 Tax=Phenylobacterium kunshanense TaxID=1445034 RepID=A0A328BFI3_9CAUL|nr:hypothetical protein [Phenylobacterium kunshanense]RAK65419.1 hypothetical protein DJ019_10645 [Phenylobacterium kunshanense]